MTRWGQSSSRTSASANTAVNDIRKYKGWQDLEDLPPLPRDFQVAFLDAAARLKVMADNIKEMRSNSAMHHFGGSAMSKDNSNREVEGTDVLGGRVTEYVMVPAHRAGLVIGHHGETLKRIEKQSQCKLQFDQQYNNSESSQRRVIIIGLAEDVEEAKRLIGEKVNDPLSKYPTININVPQSKVGLVIGKGGETIRELQEKSGARVVVQPESQMDPWTMDRQVSITGDDESISRAKKLIDDILTAAATKSATSASTSNVPIIGPNTTTIQIPENAVGAVIGKKAETLRTLQSMSGCKIFIESTATSAQSNIRNVHLTGAPEQVAYAHQLIMERVAQVEGAYYATYGVSYNYEGAAGVAANQPSVIYQNPAELAAYDYSQYYAAYAQQQQLQQDPSTFDYNAYMQQQQQQQQHESHNQYSYDNS